MRCIGAPWLHFDLRSHFRSAVASVVIDQPLSPAAPLPTVLVKRRTPSALTPHCS